jgi:hypothetical protein
MNKKANIINIILSLIVFIAVCAMVALTTYSYYKKVDDSQNQIKYNSYNMLVKYDKGNQINAYNLIPGWEGNYSFQIQNFSKDTIAKYKVSLEVLTPLSKEINDLFTFKLESISDNDDNTNKLINIEKQNMPISNKELGVSVITPNTTHTYNLNIKIDSLMEKEFLLDKMFVAKINIQSVYN